MEQTAGPHPVSHYAAEQVTALRTGRGWSQSVLADRLAAVGYSDISRGTLAKIECGDRGVHVDDLVALAAALDVSPVHVLVPFDQDRQVEVTHSMTVDAGTARRWFYGWDPLPDTDEVHYLSTAPREEWWMQRNGLVRQLTRVLAELATMYFDKNLSDDVRQDAHEAGEDLNWAIYNLVKAAKAQISEISNGAE